MSKNTSCANCLTPLQGDYCHQCGQVDKDVDKYFFALVNEAFEDIFKVNSRARITLWGLVAKPGFLSTEYFAGRRVRYISPLRLYFTLSILSFVIIAAESFFTGDKFNFVVVDETVQTQESTSNSPPTIETEEGDPSSELSDNDQDIDFSITDEEEFRIPWASEEKSKQVQLYIESQVEKVAKEYRDNPDIISDYFLEIAPPLIFCMLPIFAFLLKVFYLFKRKYYTQHLIFAVHQHCFVFLWIILITILDWSLIKLGGLPSLVAFLFFIWWVYYVWKSLKVVYQQGRLATTFKFFSLAFTYLFLSLFALGLAAVVGVLTA